MALLSGRHELKQMLENKTLEIFFLETCFNLYKALHVMLQKSSFVKNCTYYFHLTFKKKKSVH